MTNVLEFSPTAAPPPADDTARAIAHLYQLIDWAGTVSASDIHVHPDEPIALEIQGRLRRYPDKLIHKNEILHWMQGGWKRSGRTGNPLTDRGQANIAYDTGTWRVRAAFRKDTSGTSVTFRLIPRLVPTVDQLEVPESIQALTRRRAGLVLVMGPTGSGKTTLNNSLIRLVNNEQDLHVYSVEDPVEFVHQPEGDTVFTQREIGEHALDYPSAVENALRSKPNVIMIGEILDPATARSALHASTTGHLVLTTAHSGSVTQAIEGFIGRFTPEEKPQIRTQLADSLLAIVVQRLVQTKDGGRVAVRELMLNNPNFADIIRSGEMHMVNAQLESGKKLGMFSLDDDLVRLIREGRITIETALRETGDEAAFRARLSKENLS